MIYFIIWAVLNVLSIGIYLAKNGEPRIDKEHSVIRQTINVAIEVWLMYMWGAFDHLSGVQP